MNHVVTFDLSQLPALKAAALAHPLKRARINLHADPAKDRVQEMIIAEHRDTYVRPHRHPGRLESFHIVDGYCTVLIFDDAGNVTQKIRMGNVLGWERSLLCRQRESVWHTVLVETDFAVIHEVVEGPFPYETEWAPWSPRAEDTEAVEMFKAELRRKCR